MKWFRFCTCEKKACAQCDGQGDIDYGDALTGFTRPCDRCSGGVIFTTNPLCPWHGDA